MSVEISKVEIEYNDLLETLQTDISDYKKQVCKDKLLKIENRVLNYDYVRMIEREKKIVKQWKRKKEKYVAEEKRNVCQSFIQWGINEIAELKSECSFALKLIEKRHKT